MFDAFASLTAKPPGENQGQSIPLQSQPASQDAPSAPEQAEAIAEPVQSLAEADTSETVEAADAAADELASVDENPEQQPASAAAGADQLAEDPAANLYEWEFKPAPRLRHSGWWLGLSLLLVVVGLIQAGYIFRTELMVIYPPLKPLYQSVCNRLSCEIALPRLRDQLNIEASDLRSVDPQRPNLVQLTALVRNRAPVPVEYPAFELTLTNAQQQVVARRVFLPGDYLDNDATTDDGLAGRRELSVNMYLDTGPLRAAGYRIYLFYPPPG